jgi:hypothetical protein
MRRCSCGTERTLHVPLSHSWLWVATRRNCGCICHGCVTISKPLQLAQISPPYFNHTQTVTTAVNQCQHITHRLLQLQLPVPTHHTQTVTTSVTSANISHTDCYNFSYQCQHITHRPLQLQLPSANTSHTDRYNCSYPVPTHSLSLYCPFHALLITVSIHCTVLCQHSSHLQAPS